MPLSRVAERTRPARMSGRGAWVSGRRDGIRCNDEKGPAEAGPCDGVLDRGRDQPLASCRSGWLWPRFSSMRSLYQLTKSMTPNS